MSKRAASGESSIYRGNDGRWHGYVSMGLKRDGERDRRHVSGQRRADVVGKVRALEDTRDAGVVLVSGRAPTVAAWLLHWHQTIAVRRLRPKTFEGYGQQIRNHLVPHLGHHRLDRLQPEHVEAAWRELEAEGLSPATVLMNHRILSRALKVAMQRGQVSRNVVTLVDAPSVSRPRSSRSPPTRFAACSPPRRMPTTAHAGRPPSRSGCGRARPLACCGRTSTCRPAP